MLHDVHLPALTTLSYAGLKVEIEGLTESKVDSTAMDGYAKQISQVCAHLEACAHLHNAWPRSELTKCKQAMGIAG